MPKTLLFLIISALYLILISVVIYPYYSDKGEMGKFLLIIAGNVIVILALAYLFKRQQKRKK
ncbi:hypothetical protein [Dysgonomonas macrotermitis]|uniref:Uncharacterized protein n=1 Tax=Dysgonomonas macrotermitis TaxID=1346286 RepID=A0A1M5CC96_9BACT|nr:hypothetical protein [Dysgonomonas macrotermitis]SHF52320.1 hypothetical protein SAMN05444362_107113 [Dysgonomonas macrotermitis]